LPLCLCHSLLLSVFLPFVYFFHPSFFSLCVPLFFSVSVQRRLIFSPRFLFVVATCFCATGHL
jgi:hypothetical protein